MLLSQIKLLDFAKAMKWMDPSIELIACGYDLGSDWNYEVARVLKPLISHIAIHHYSIGYDIFKEEDYNQCMYIPDYLTKLTNVAKASNPKVQESHPVTENHIPASQLPYVQN